MTDNFNLDILASASELRHNEGDLSKAPRRSSRRTAIKEQVESDSETNVVVEKVSETKHGRSSNKKSAGKENNSNKSQKRPTKKVNSTYKELYYYSQVSSHSLFASTYRKRPRTQHIVMMIGLPLRRLSSKPKWNAACSVHPATVPDAAAAATASRYEFNGNTAGARHCYEFYYASCTAQSRPARYDAAIDAAWILCYDAAAYYCWPTRRGKSYAV